jgi:hypothetical protein
MSYPAEIYFATCQVLFGYWPLMFLAAFESLFQAVRGLSQLQKRMVQSLLLVWGFFATLRLAIFLAGRQPEWNFIAEPAGSMLFMLTGFGLLALQGYWVWVERLKPINLFETIESLDQLRALSQKSFVHLVAQTYRIFGHRISQITASSGLLEVSTASGEKWIVRCFNGSQAINEAEVREMYNLIHHENAHRGALISQCGFTHRASDWALGKPIYLFDGESFLNVMDRARQFKPAVLTLAR